jgi:GNAT superfamily N-acetyltransferase
VAPDASKTSASIRPATPSDAEAILACLRAAFEPYRNRYTPEGFLDTVLTPTTIQERLAAMSVLVAVTLDGHTVGTVAYQVAGDEGHLRGMAVLPAHAGTGVAHQLLESAERELRDRGCSRISLDTTEPLRRAIRFYERHGFRPSGRVSDFFGMPLFEYGKELT